jgi:diguanylate cyclase (GGDEF)-like protein
LDWGRLLPAAAARLFGRLDFSGYATRPLLPATVGKLVVAAILLVVDLVLVAVAALPPLPFLVFGAAFVLSILTVLRGERRDRRRAARDANLINLLLVLKVCALVVGVTGGPISFFVGLLYIPMFLGALYFELRGSLGVGLASAAFLLLFDGSRPGGGRDQSATVMLAIVLVVVSIFAGIFARRLTREARAADRRAREQRQRAAEFEWFTDTSVMMESLLDLETMLSAGLMRVAELLPCDCAGFFLREPEMMQMTLIQFSSTRGAVPQKRSLTIEDQDPLRMAGFGIAFWSALDRVAGERAIGAFCEVVPDAGAVMVATLRTWDDVFGAVYVSAANPGTFTEQHRDLLSHFARHVVYPIQRVRLQAMATTDVMTGLYNQRALRRRLRDEVERARRYAHPLSLILLDIDHFKRVNDTLGHRAGDVLLAQIGGILRWSLRGIDFAARYGGEEMVILCPETRPEDAYIVAERLREVIAARLFDLPGSPSARVTVSFGVAGIPTHASDEAALIEAADNALYMAKGSGRNRVCVAAPLAPRAVASGSSIGRG